MEKETSKFLKISFIILIIIIGLVAYNFFIGLLVNSYVRGISVFEAWIIIAGLFFAGGEAILATQMIFKKFNVFLRVLLFVLGLTLISSAWGLMGTFFFRL